jgi:hypothetical protein
MADPSETTQVSRAPAELESQEELLAAVRALATEVGSLQAEIHLLRGQPSALPVESDERPGWEEAPAGALRESGAWVRSLDAPTARHLSIPWLLIELLFLVGVAVLAAVAGLDSLAIIGLMLLAWIIVAAAEWASARAIRQRSALAYGPPRVVRASPPQDPSWLEPPSERTALDVSDALEGEVTRLPPSPE